MVRNSVKPWPTLPSAKYHVGLVGPIPVAGGVGVIIGVVGDGVGTTAAGIFPTLCPVWSVNQTLLKLSTPKPSRGFAVELGRLVQVTTPVVGLRAPILLNCESLK